MGCTARKLCSNLCHLEQGCVGIRMHQDMQKGVVSALAFEFEALV